RGGRLHGRRRLGLLQAVRALQRQHHHGPGRLRRRGRHPGGTGRLPDRHPALLPARCPDRRLGELRGRHGGREQRPCRIDRVVLRLRGPDRSGQPLRPGRLHPQHPGSTGERPMRRPRVRRLACAVALALGAALLSPGVQSAAAADPYQVLVFSKTAGFRHDSIPAGITALHELGAANDFTVTATEDATAFTPQNLADYEAVVFLSTTGDVLNDTQQSALKGYVDGGGGFVGVHAAADTEYDWPEY